MNVGVYALICPLTGAVLYVGASEDLDTRRRSHYKKLRRGVHLDEFQEWYSVNGVIPEFRVLEHTNVSSLNHKEIHWFNKLNPMFYGVEPDGDKWVMTDHTRSKISSSIRGLWKGYRLDDGRACHVHHCSLCKKKFMSVKLNQIFCTEECQAKYRRSNFDIKTAVSMYSKGMSYRDIAAALGVSRTLVMRRFRENGVIVRPKTEQPKYRT